jgi:hypothetical protein
VHLARISLDRHATDIVAAYIAGAARWPREADPEGSLATIGQAAAVELNRSTDATRPARVHPGA